MINPPNYMHKLLCKSRNPNRSWHRCTTRYPDIQILSAAARHKIRNADTGDDDNDNDNFSSRFSWNRNRGFNCNFNFKLNDDAKLATRFCSVLFFPVFLFFFCFCGPNVRTNCYVWSLQAVQSI